MFWAILNNKVNKKHKNAEIWTIKKDIYLKVWELK